MSAYVVYFSKHIYTNILSIYEDNSIENNEKVEKEVKQSESSDKKSTAIPSPIFQAAPATVAPARTKAEKAASSEESDEDRGNRKRRRRGGRNRNRRDRDQVDSNTSENTGMDDSGAGMHADHIESNTVEVVQQFIEHAHEAHASHQADAPASIAESYSAAPSWTSQPVETPTTAAVTEAPAVKHQVTQVDSHAHEHHDHQHHHAEYINVGRSSSMMDRICSNQFRQRML